MIKPKVLKKGDTIGIVSPSSPLGGLLKHRLKQGIKSLEDLGFKVKLGKNALKVTDYTAGSFMERAEDLNSMFANKNIKGIISMIGGFHSNQIVDLLDYDLISKNPKVFIGFSDISVLHFAINTQSLLVTFYGPAILTQFGEKFGVDNYTLEYFKKAVMSVEPIGEITPSKNWTDEVLDWFLKKDLERPRSMKKNEGHIWLKEGNCKGELIGGCITSILHLRGTKYWPDFKNKIFFWEIPESSSDITRGEPLSKVDAHLVDLKLSGVFDEVAGMIIGRPKGYSEGESKKLKNVILSNFSKHSFPILYNVNIGHTDPIITLPIGVEAELNSKKNSFRVIESAVIK